ncbi:hypothetical protein HZB08_00920, partial [Candidatus Saganbacteria bacterium]|nr:hypothetical protein [Candidatus Saganbacteria bacterium]
MKRLKFFFAIMLLFLAFTNNSQAVDLNYPYGRVNLKLPPSDDPFPGMGGYYSALPAGMKSVLWNPASLGKLTLSEASISLASTAGSYNMDKVSKITEPSGTLEVGAGTGGKSPMNYALFFRYPSALTGIGTATKEVEIKSNLNYATSDTGINFSAAQKINDWLMVGFSTGSPLGMDADLAGNFPVTGRMALNLYGKNMGDMQISSSGKFKFTFKAPDGTVSTPETVSSVWSGFLSQEATFPFTGLSELRNNLNVQLPYMGAIASHFGDFYAGLNVIPISAAAQIDNDVRTMVNADAADQLLYVPDFDPNNATEGGNWLSDPDKYGKEGGYKRKQIKLPTGEIIASSKYRGFYNGSAARTDFGIMYDVNEWFTIAAAFENIGGTSLTLKGNGLAGYLNYRDINTSEADTLLKPGESTSWAPFTDRWITTFEAGGNKFYLEPEKNYPLPKKIHYGISLKRPFLVAIDYEQNQTPFTLPLSPEVTIGDMGLIRIGMESRLFNLPCQMRMGVTLLLKPTVTTTDQATKDKINSYFRYGVVPLKLDMGTIFTLWGYKIGSSFGVNATPLISLFQFDVNNLDASKLVHYGLSVGKDSWEVNYISQADPLSTASAYNNKPAPADGQKSFGFSDVKFVQT